jgi:hypothetical protein
MFSRALTFSLAFLLAGCGGGSGSYPIGIDIAPISPKIALGDSAQFTATAHFSNGPDQNVTRTSSWTTSPRASRWSLLAQPRASLTWRSKD